MCVRVSNFLLFILLLLVYTSSAQSTYRTNYKQLTIDNPQLLAKLKPFLKQQNREVYICTSQMKDDRVEYTLQPVGNLSEFKERSTSLYINLENSLIFVVTGLESLIDQERFFKEIIRPFTKGRIVDDVLPNGQINQDAVPSTYDAQGIVITMKQATIEIRWVNN